jgi:hypothetical protein
MKKIVFLSLLFITLNIFAKNETFAQSFFKPENCAYFQTIHGDDQHVTEWIWVGKDRDGESLKWLALIDDESSEAYIETSRDEWSIYLKPVVSGENREIQIDLHEKKVKSIKSGQDLSNIVKVLDEYDYDKLGGEYID